MSKEKNALCVCLIVAMWILYLALVKYFDTNTYPPVTYEILGQKWNVNNSLISAYLVLFIFVSKQIFFHLWWPETFVSMTRWRKILNLN